MDAAIEDELRQRAVTRILQEVGLTKIEQDVLLEWVTRTPEARGAEEIRHLRSMLAARDRSGPTSTVDTVGAPGSRYRTAIATCARWETDNILEWVTYHRSLGFDHIYLYCNDDDPAELYERLSPLVIGYQPYVTFVYYPFVGLQTAMYKHLLRTAGSDSKWLLFLDIDEFVALKSENPLANIIGNRPPTLKNPLPGQHPWTP